MGSGPHAEPTADQLRSNGAEYDRRRAPGQQQIMVPAGQANLPSRTAWSRRSTCVVSDPASHIGRPSQSQGSVHPTSHPVFHPGPNGNGHGQGYRASAVLNGGQGAIGEDGRGSHAGQRQVSAMHHPGVQQPAFAQTYPSVTAVPQSAIASGGSGRMRFSAPQLPYPGTQGHTAPQAGPAAGYYYTQAGPQYSAGSSAMQTPLLEDRVLRPPPNLLLPSPANGSEHGKSKSNVTISQLVDRLVAAAPRSEQQAYASSAYHEPLRGTSMVHRQVWVSQQEPGLQRNGGGQREQPRSVYKEMAAKKRKREETTLDTRGDGSYALRKRVKRSVVGFEDEEHGDDEEYQISSDGSDESPPDNGRDGAMEAAAALLAGGVKPRVEPAAPPKRRRGRPRVYPPGQSPSALKRKMYKGTGRPRGRPRKHPKKEEVKSDAS